MTFFPSSALQAIRALSNGAMDCQCHIQEVTGNLREPGGVSVPVYSTVRTVPCRVAQAAGASPEFIVGDAPKSQPSWMVVVDSGTNILTNARLVVEGTHSTGVPWTRYFRVLGGSGPRSNEAMQFVFVEDVPAES